MKIKSLEIKNNKVLKDMKLNFCNYDKNYTDVMNTIIIAGSNGSGKTTLLESIYYGIEKITNSDTEKFLYQVRGFDFEFNKEEEKLIKDFAGIGFFFSKLNKGEHKNCSLPKIIYIPAEINFKDVKTQTTKLKSEYKFLNIVDTNIIKNIPSYIASKIMYTANTEEDLTMKEVREKVTKEINEIFDILDIDVKLKGLSRDELSTLC